MPPLPTCSCLPRCRAGRDASGAAAGRHHPPHWPPASRAAGGADEMAGGDGAKSRRPRPAQSCMRALLTMAVDVHFAALEEPLAVHPTQLILVAPERGE